jgi:hypothetical protein
MSVLEIMVICDFGNFFDTNIEDKQELLNSFDNQLK